MPPLKTIRETAAILTVCQETVRRLIQEGKLRSVRIGRVFRVTEKAIQDYIESTEK
jgi:excisionase family DNA binding protein